VWYLKMNIFYNNIQFKILRQNYYKNLKIKIYDLKFFIIIKYDGSKKFIT
jgi:hypothetical protein